MKSGAVSSVQSQRQVMRLTLPPEMVTRIVADVLQEVCDLGGYDSPDDQPELIMCTLPQLELIVRRALGQDP
jgi:hypothetical protein